MKKSKLLLIVSLIFFVCTDVCVVLAERSRVREYKRKTKNGYTTVKEHYRDVSRGDDKRGVAFQKAYEESKATNMGNYLKYSSLKPVILSRETDFTTPYEVSGESTTNENMVKGLFRLPGSKDFVLGTLGLKHYLQEWQDDTGIIKGVLTGESADTDKKYKTLEDQDSEQEKDNEN